ncbi:MAG: hypothetical protein KDB14_25995 [Planctomycetales bacterium]|nr:hypothetical protein [Planctomycetales bacterium]
MPINVICPGCQKRFSVSEKFAGKKGPCPKCKTQIKIPEVSAEDVVVHAPESFGPKDSQGQSVLKPIARREFTVSRVQIIASVSAVIGVLIGALVLRGGEVSPVVLGLGAVLLGPPLAMAAYTFLRDDELEPYMGRSLWLRSLACGASFAAMWGVYAALKWLVLGGDVELFQLVFLVPPLLFGGAVAAWAAFDLDLGNGAFAIAMYLGATIVLRLIMSLGPF